MKKTMKNAIKILLTMSLSMLLLTACSTKLPEDVIASVNGVDIPVEYYEKTIAKVGEDNGFEAVYGPDVWTYEIEPGITFKQKFSHQMLDIIITQEMVYQDAVSKNLVADDKEIQDEYDAYMEIVKKDPEYSAFVEKNNIDEAFVKEHLTKSLTYNKYSSAMMEEISISDEEIQKYYDENIADFTKNEVKASHILISTMDENDQPLTEDKKAAKLDEANEILGRAKAGEDFAALAEEYSDDPGSAINGGDLGFFQPGVMVPEFNDAAFAMKVGDISDIVETQFGYHIIYVTDKNDEVTSFEEAKETIKNQLKFKKYEEQMADLTKSTKIIVNEALAAN